MSLHKSKPQLKYLIWFLLHLLKVLLVEQKKFNAGLCKVQTDYSHLPSEQRPSQQRRHNQT